MNKTILSIFLAFFVQVKIPAGISKAYETAKDIELMPGGFTIRLVLANDKIVLVPALFTIIEEE